MHVCVYNFVILTHEKNLHKLLREKKNVPSTYYQDVNMKCSNNAHTLHGKKSIPKAEKYVTIITTFPMTGFVCSKKFSSQRCV